METTILLLEKSLITGTYVNLQGELVKDLEVVQAIISGSKYANNTFENVIFIDCDFQGTDILETKFIDCKFINCNFSFTKIEDCNFIACTIENCNFCITNSLNCNFLSCTFITNTSDNSQFKKGNLINCYMDEQSSTEIDFTSTLSTCAATLSLNTEVAA